MDGTTVGIDLAPQDRNTAVCRIRWGTPTTIDAWRAGVDDAQIDRLIRSPEVHKVGIDVPLGWPIAFAAALSSYMDRGPWLVPHTDPRLRLRATDRYVAEHARTPLSVSSDRIAIPAMRAARLLSSIDAGFDRTGRGRVVETYPAASLRAWGFPPEGYKRSAGRQRREELVADFIDATSAWVSIGDEQRRACVDDDNVFDALICALTARAAELDLCHPVPEKDLEAARVEGWIALPRTGTLATLSGPSEP